MKQISKESVLNTPSVTEVRELLLPQSTPVLILAGGLGARLKTITQNKIPKALVPLSDGRTFIDQLLDGLDGAGFEDYYFCLGVQSEQIISHLMKREDRENYNFSIEDTPLGTGGAINLALERFSINRPFLVVTSDAKFPYDELPDLLSAHKPSTITWAVCKNAISSMSQYSGQVVLPEFNILIQNRNSQWASEDRLTKILAEGLEPTELIDSGHGVIDPNVFKWAFNMFKKLCPNRDKVCLYKDILPMVYELSRRRFLRNQEPVAFAFIEREPTLDMGTTDRLNFALLSSLINFPLSS